MAITTYKAKVSSTEQPHKYISHVRDFQVIFETTKKDNGYDEGVMPNEGILCALSACEDIVAGAFYKRKKFEYSSLYITAQGQISGNRPGYDQINLDIHFRTPKNKEEINKFVEFMENTCPVKDNLSNKVPIVTEEINVH